MDISRIEELIMNKIATALLGFRQRCNLSDEQRICDGLSGVVSIGNTLWVVNDEMISLERLKCQGKWGDGTYRYGDHEQFELDKYIQLPAPSPSNPEDIQEADIEGLDYSDGYLWLIGSHSLKRTKPKQEKSDKDNFERLAKVSADANRFLLARIPVMTENGIYVLEREGEQDGKRRTAAQLHGDDKSSELTVALAQDEHLQAFLSIPSKDNGFDIEGVAVVGDRIFIGLRGPVLRGWAVILEIELKEDEDKASTMKLKNIGPDDRPYHKHFLALGGLGIRDLCVRGSDLLILAGPTMDLDGPVTLINWPGGTQPEGDSLVFADQLPIVMEVPYGRGKNKGMDHAEGITLFGENAHSVLIVYDAASKDRQNNDDNSVTADIFELPG
jgi:hypothetical protein